MLRHGPHADAGARRGSARAILQGLLDRWGRDQVTLQIQYEMVDDRVTLDQTTAGRALAANMEAAQEANAEKIAEYDGLLREMEHEGDQLGGSGETAREMLGQQSDLRRQLEESRRAQADMRAGIFELHQRERDRLLAQLEAMEAGWESTLAEKTRQEELKEAAFLEMQRQWAEERQRLEDAKQFAGAQATGYPLELDPRVQQLAHQQRVLEEQEARHKEELQKVQAEVAKLRQETQAKAGQTRRAKAAWGSKQDWAEATRLGIRVGEF